MFLKWSLHPITPKYNTIQHAVTLHRTLHTWIDTITVRDRKWIEIQCTYTYTYIYTAAVHTIYIGACKQKEYIQILWTPNTTFPTSQQFWKILLYVRMSISYDIVLLFRMEFKSQSVFSKCHVSMTELFGIWTAFPDYQVEIVEYKQLIGAYV